MSERFVSCSIALIVAVTSAAIVWMGLERLSWETHRSSLTVGDLKLGANHFSFETSASKSDCFGALTATLRDEGAHYSITLQGWVKLAVFGKLWVQDFKGQLSFNPLAQLGVSILEIPSGDDTVRIGTQNINPMTLLVFRSAKDSKPILQQDIPGPVELRREGTVFKITAPIPIDGGLRLPITPMLAAMPLRVKKIPSAACTTASSRPLDVTGILSTVANLRTRFVNPLQLNLP